MLYIVAATLLPPPYLYTSCAGAVYFFQNTGEASVTQHERILANSVHHFLVSIFDYIKV